MLGHHTMSSRLLSRSNLTRHAEILQATKSLHREQFREAEVSCEEVSASRRTLVNFLNGLARELESPDLSDLSFGCSKNALVSSIQPRQAPSGSLTPAVALATIHELTDRISSSAQLSSDDFDLLETLVECVASPIAMELHRASHSYAQAGSPRAGDQKSPACKVD